MDDNNVHKTEFEPKNDSLPETSPQDLPENINESVDKSDEPMKDQPEDQPVLDKTDTVRESVFDDYNYLIGENGFSLKEDDDLNFKANRSSRTKNKSRKKKKTVGGLKTVLWVIVICVVSVLLAAGILLFSCEYLGIRLSEGKECTVEIKRGMSTSQIADQLEKSDAISNKLLFRVFSKLGGYDGTYKYGVYTFTNELGYKDLAKMLQTQGEVADSVEVTIPEGSSIDDIIKILSEKGVCTKSDFRNAVRNGKYDFDFVNEIPVSAVYYRFEGYLFPDTYRFYCYDSSKCAELAIRKMLENLDKRLTPEIRTKIKNSGYTIHQVLTMSSIVELEASNAPSEMPNVAAVFYNRLHWDEPKLLGSSPTAKYPYGNGRYDTNKTEGLPPGPLCAPSENAIKAAVNPTPNFAATYFVTDSDMKFYYNNSLADHQKTIAKLKAQNKWLG